jgi:oligosaccharide repeat unit polymerase
MLDLVLILNVAVAIWGGQALFRQTRNYVIYLFEAVFLMFFVVRPFSVSYFGALSFDLLRFGIDEQTVLTYALCGLVFAAVFHMTVYKLYRRPRLFSDRFFRVCDFARVSRARFTFVLVVFGILTYAVNAFKFRSLMYFAQNLDSFAAGVSLEGGLWFVQILSWILIFPLIALLGRNLEAKPGRLFYLLLVAVIMFNVVAKPSTRTETLTLLMAVGVYSFSTGKIKVNLSTVGIFSVVAVLMLVFLDGLRQGNLTDGFGQSTVYSILVAAFQNVGPADNAMILIDYLKHHSWMYFRYLLASLSPLSLVPSALFPFKPRIDMEGVLTYQLFGFDLDPTMYHEGGTLTYTVPVAGYADFGFIGVVVAAILYGFIFSVFLRGWKSKLPSIRFATLYYLVFLVAGFRLSMEALMQTFYWVILATWSMHFVSHFKLPQPTTVSGRKAPSLPGADGSSAAG